MAAPSVFTITYWGTTGTLACPLQPPDVTDKVVHAIHHLLETGQLAKLASGPESLSRVRQLVEWLPLPLRSTYGGNTTCVQVETPDALIILDCGSGLRPLGIALSHRWNAPGYQGERTAHVLISHPHMDHTLAIPFTSPFFDPRNHFTLWGSRSLLRSLAAVLSPRSPLSHTFFPPTYDLMKAVKDFNAIEAGDDFDIGSTRIRTFALNHPGNCLAYRLENAGRVFVFATDHEPPEVPDRALAAFARGADVFYTDGQYLDAEYEGREPIPQESVLSRRGWGHGTVEACVATALHAGVRELHLGHREPLRSDEELARVEEYAQRLLREGLKREGRNADDCRVLIPVEGLTVRL
jgi:phosphoribosyl 1,2-cyclic phosphodiesterase